jgi:hypothetical protein
MIQVAVIMTIVIIANDDDDFDILSLFVPMKRRYRTQSRFQSSSCKFGHCGRLGDSCGKPGWIHGSMCCIMLLLR